MKIIDARGKFFGFINIIDLGIIVILMVFGYIFFNLARNAKLGYPIEVKVKVLFPSLPKETVGKLQPGDVEDRSHGRSKLLRFEIGEKHNNIAADVYAWLNLSMRLKDVPVGNRGHKTSSYFLKGAELNINDPVIFTTSKYSIRGTLLNIDRMDREIEVILSQEIPDEVIDAVRVGDRVVRYEHLIGEVIDKKYTDNGKVRVGLHIVRGEVSLKIGDQFPFETERYVVWGFIVKSRPWKNVKLKAQNAKP